MNSIVRSYQTVTESVKKYHIVLLTGRDHTYTVKPFGAHKCAHELRRAGFDTVVINHINNFGRNELQNLLQLVISNTTLFVGLSNTFLKQWCNQNLANIAHMVRQLNPRCRIVLGGADSNYVDAYPDIDYLVMGYADHSIVNLANHLHRGEALTKARRSIHGFTIIDDPLAEGFDIQNSLMQWHDDDLVTRQDRVLPLEVSRGCVFRCAFCTFILNGKKNGDYIKRPDILKQELLNNYDRFGITAYRLLDDTFNDNRDKLDQIESITRDLPFRLRLWSYTRLDLLSKHPDTIDQLTRIGVRSMTFGIETFNKTTGRIIGKGYDPELQIKTIQDIKARYGDDVVLTSHFIVGLPEESKESVQTSINRMETGEIPLDGWNFKPLQIKKRDTISWDSAFNLDMTKYGYVDTGKKLPGHLVHWKNPYMDYSEALGLAHSGSRRINGFQEFEIYGLGYDFDYIKSRWQKMTSEYLAGDYENFVNRYKQYVFEYLRS